MLISLFYFLLFLASIKVSIVVEDYLQTKYQLFFWADAASVIIVAPFLFFNHFFLRQR